jgi:serine/threonine protein kinase
MSFTPGQQVGDYEILGPLGAGGMGRVYRVKHLISRRDEALKVLLHDVENDQNLCDRFVREIQVQARLNHPCIASLHTAFRLDNRLLMVMELVEGESLRHRMRKPGVALPEGVAIVRQVLDALAHAHSLGVTHRDIKPSNIMLTNQGQVKLLDFGLATVTGDNRLTKSGAIVGSIHYMAPEQIRCENSDARTDIYSTAVTLWEIAAGRPPFASDIEYAILTGHLETIPEPPRADHPEVPEALWQILLRALAKRPEERFQSAHEFNAALANLPQGAAFDHPAQTTRTIVPAAPTTTDSRPSDPNLLDTVSRELALYVGPIARVLVKRHAPKAASLEGLYKSLAEEIESPADRQKFLSARSRRDPS